MSLTYRAEIDGLRAVAVVPVVLFHAGFTTLGGGYVGVDVFFVISGYLITSIIMTDLAGGQFSLLHFYERRARRILPALFFIVGLSCIAAWFILMPQPMQEFARSVAAVATFTANILFARQSGYFDTDAGLVPLLHTWSLAVEEQYYILFPLILMLAWRWKRRWVVAILGLLFVFSMTIGQWGSIQKPDLAFFLLISRGWEILLGAFAAFILHDRRQVIIPRALAELIAFTGLALIAVAVFAFSDATPVAGIYTLIPTFGAFLVILFATGDTATGRLLGWRGCVGMGLISYSVYLWHQPLLVFTRYLWPAPPSLALMGAVGALSFPLGYLTWRFIEAPFRRSRTVPRRTVFGLAVTGTALFLVLGLTGDARQGFLDRYDGIHRQNLSRQFDAGDYVVAAFDALRMRPFAPADSRPRLLVIGDSFAQDMINVLQNSALKGYYQVATAYIPARCGSVWTDADVTNDLPAAFRQGCADVPRYADPALQALIAEADEIWLVSHWADWELPYMPETLDRIATASDARLRLFSAKSWGRVDYRARRSMGLPELAAVRVDPNVWQPSHDAINAALRRIAEPAVFVDLDSAYCDSPGACRLFSSQGALLSHDGGHLTPEGAVYFGAALSDLLGNRGK